MKGAASGHEPGSVERRRTLVAVGAGLFTGLFTGLGPCAGLAAPTPQDVRALTDRLNAIEARIRGRLGVTLLGAGGSPSLFHRADERFPFCSTFKWLAAAAVLARVDRGLERLDRQVRVPNRVLSYAPVTKRFAGRPMSLSDLCAAAVTLSDNTAGNLVLAAAGGPGGLTRFLRSIGDGQTRSDRWEPDLNEAKPGDRRDTSTPRAMAENLQRILLGTVLSPSMRDQLMRWMLDCQTSAHRFRAGLPPDWRLADKTGSGDYGTTNDVGVFLPPSGAPLCLTVFLTQSRAPEAQRERALADVAALVTRPAA